MRRWWDVALGEPVLEPLQIAGHDRGEIGVGNSGGGALVLAVLGEDFERGGDVQATGAGAIGDEALVLRVGEGEQEGDGQGLNSGGLEVVQEAIDLLQVQGLEDLALVVQAEFVGDEGWGAVRSKVVKLGSGLASDEEDVAEAAGGDEGGGCAPTLDEALVAMVEPWSKVSG